MCAPRIQVVPELVRNIHDNGLGGACRADVLDWSSPGPQHRGRYGLVLAADVVYVTRCVVRVARRRSLLLYG